MRRVSRRRNICKESRDESDSEPDIRDQPPLSLFYFLSETLFSLSLDPTDNQWAIQAAIMGALLGSTTAHNNSNNHRQQQQQQQRRNEVSTSQPLQTPSDQMTN